MCESHTSTLEVSAIREGYRPVAAAAGVLFLAVSSLSLINPMLQHSLSFLRDVLKQTLCNVERKDSLTNRVGLLLSEITQSVYSRVCRGLFERDRLLLAVMISARLDIAAGCVTESEWLCFMAGCVLDPTIRANHPLPEALRAVGVGEGVWDRSVMLETLHSVPFRGLTCDIRGPNSKEWAAFFSSDAPHTERLPGVWEAQLSPFHRLLLVRTLREEALLPSISRYIGECCIVAFGSR